MLIKTLSKLYQIPLPETVSGDDRGAINQTWFIGDSLVLTIFKNRDIDQVKLIGEITAQDSTGFLPKPILSLEGPTCVIDGKPAVLWQRINGSHYVERDHSVKLPIPDIGHYEVASAFWGLHSYLSKYSDQTDVLGRMDYGSFVYTAQEKVRAEAIPDFMQKGFIQDYLASNPLPQKYPALVHTDMERHNILHNSAGHVVGIVDVDAIMHGDILFEYAHVMMNYLFTDPAFSASKADIYIDAMLDADKIQTSDVITLPRHIRSFAAEDLFYYWQNDVSRKTDLKHLTEIYDVGIQRMEAYFSELNLSKRPSQKHSGQPRRPKP